ncbi:hypothetical protein J4402_00905 [Candidatus Pacearchaeota archaeon]|nr:50S ribosomal protein L22P [uncultured archaeon]MBS3088318.1 hypothetical protein [Candidatus Pacearchaeota archaeon]
MTTQISQPIEEKKSKVAGQSIKNEAKTTAIPVEDSSKITTSPESQITTSPEKKKEPKKEQPKLTKKDEAIARGLAVHMSKKHAMYICSFIKNKSIDESINYLEQVIKLKKVIPFKGEIPHRKGKGIMSGRYPVNASKLFISILKSLKGNVIVNQMELENTRITFASACWAARPMRRGSVKGKRTNVILKAREVRK